MRFNDGMRDNLHFRYVFNIAQRFARWVMTCLCCFEIRDAWRWDVKKLKIRITDSIFGKNFLKTALKKCTFYSIQVAARYVISIAMTNKSSILIWVLNYFTLYGIEMSTDCPNASQLLQERLSVTCDDMLWFAGLLKWPDQWSWTAWSGSWSAIHHRSGHSDLTYLSCWITITDIITGNFKLCKKK